MFETLVVATLGVLFIAASRVMYEKEMEDFKNSERAAAYRRGSWGGAVRVEDLEFMEVVDPLCASAKIRQDWRLRNHCECRTCNNARQRAMMLKN